MPNATIDTAATLLAKHTEPGRLRRLSDLLACTQTTPASVYLADATAARASDIAAAKQPHLKYARPPIALTALTEADGYRLSGADELVAATRPADPTDWIGTADLPGFFATATTIELRELTRRALPA